MSSRVTITYKNPGTINAVPIIVRKRPSTKDGDYVVDGSRDNDSGAVVLPGRKGRPRQKAKRAAEEHPA